MTLVQAALPRAVSQESKLKNRVLYNVKIGAGAGRRLMRGGSANAARGALGAMPPWVPRGISTVSLRYLYGISTVSLRYMYLYGISTVSITQFGIRDRAYEDRR